MCRRDGSATAVLFEPVVTADDIAPGIVDGKCDAFAVEQANEILQVQPLNKIGCVAAPLGELGAVFRRQRGDAGLPVERPLNGWRWIGTRRRRGRQRDTGKLDKFAARIGIAQAAMLGEEINGVALTAAGKTFPALLAVVANVKAEAGG